MLLIYLRYWRDALYYKLLDRLNAVPLDMAVRHTVNECRKVEERIAKDALREGVIKFYGIPFVRSKTFDKRKVN